MFENQRFKTLSQWRLYNEEVRLWSNVDWVQNGAKASYEDQHIISDLFFEPSTRTTKPLEVADEIGCDLLDLM